MTTEQRKDLSWEKIVDLQNKREITLGINVMRANTYWHSISTVGKILNWGTYAVIVTGIVFLFINWKIALIMLVGAAPYAYAVTKIATSVIRRHILTDKKAFYTAYVTGIVVIRQNDTGEMLRFPDDLEKPLGEEVEV